jgi:hypothetical protein
MSIEAVTPRTRRALLAAGLGAIAAGVSNALGRAPAARAADGGPVLLGNANDATNTTKVTAAGSATGLEGVSTSGAGVDGESASGVGVVGTSATGLAVAGVSESGVALYAINGSPTSPAVAAGSFNGATGVAGISTTSTPLKLRARLRRATIEPMGASLPGKTGVYGEASQDTTAIGVSGHSAAGAGVQGASETGYALRTLGRLSFSTSGVATISGGSSTAVVVPGVDVTPSSFVLLTPRKDIGSRSLWYTLNPGTNRFAIHIGSPMPTNTKVAWLLVG